MWATELAWWTNPPFRYGVSPQTQARYLQQGLYILWREGVDTIFWLQIIDDPPGGFPGGLYFYSGQPKPSAAAFKFPFLTMRSQSRVIRAWGLPPATGTLRIQRQAGQGWTTILRIPVRHRNTFFVRLPTTRAGTYRAHVGRFTSVPWVQQ
jgi:hypothetical protein